MSSRLSSLDSGTRRASAASFIQFDRQLRQNPARFIRSRFCTSACARRCSTRRRKAAASSSVRVLSSSAMAASFHQESRGASCSLENSHCPTYFPAAEYLPLQGLFDSHILEPQFESHAILDAAEVLEAPSHHEWAWLAVISSPAAQAGNYPGGESKRPFRMRVLLPFSVAFELS